MTRFMTILFAATLSTAAPGATQETPAASLLPSITVSAIAQARIVDRVRASGLIEPVERVLVQPKIEGQTIEAILVEIGDRVDAGDGLARLSTDDLVLERRQLEASQANGAATIAQAEAQIVEAETILEQALRTQERVQRLAGQGATSATAAEDAASAATTADARVEVARQGLNAAAAQLRVVDAQLADVDLRLRQAEVTAPVAGQIVERGARIGAIASKVGDPLFVIVRDGLLELHGDVAEQDLLPLRAGMNALIAVPGLDAPIEGRIRLVEPSVNTATRQGRVRIAIDEPERVRAGMFADAEITVVAREALFAPVSAVQRDDGGPTVLRVRDGAVARTPVVTGIRDGGRLEILDGLEEGDLVVAKAGAFVRDGDRINPVMAAPLATISN